MKIGRSITAPAIGLAALTWAAGSAAAPVTAAANASGSATVLKSLSILRRTDLEFGNVIVSGSGTVVLDPASGTITPTGGVTPSGSAAHAATFTATGSRNSVVLIRVPKTAVTLTRVGGGGTMTVSNWTLDGPTNRRVPLTSTIDFAVGGTLNVAAGQPEGDYSGTFTVTVQYP